MKENPKMKVNHDIYQGDPLIARTCDFTIMITNLFFSLFSPALKTFTTRHLISIST